MKNSRFLQAGMTIPELTVAVVVAGILAAASAKAFEYTVRSSRAGVLASQGATVYDTLQNYAAANIDALINGQPVPGVAAPLAPTETELRNLGYTSFSTATNAGPGISWNYALSLTPVGCAPQTCNVLVHAWLNGAPRTKDNTADIPLVAEAARDMKRPAGFSTVGSPTVITGLNAAWSTPNPVGSQAGILSVYGSYGSGQFGNYVRMGDTRPVTLNNSLAVQGTTTVGGSVSVAGARLDMTAPNARITSDRMFAGTITASNASFGSLAVDGYPIRLITNEMEVRAGETYWEGNLYLSDPAPGSTFPLVLDGSGGPTSQVGSVYANDFYVASVGRWASQMVGPQIRTARCAGNACNINLPSAGLWTIHATAKSHMSVWCGANLYINGNWVDGLADHGDQQGTGYGVMAGVYTVNAAAPGNIPVTAGYCADWGGGSIILLAIRGS